MRHFVIILAAFVASSCARPAYVAQSDARAASLRGNVTRIRETLHDISDGRLLDTTILSQTDTYTVVNYNHAGNITLTEAFVGPDSMQTTKEEYFYDHSGRYLQRSVSHNLARRGSTTILYNYDDKNRLTSEVESNGFFHFTHTHNRRGYPTKEIDNSPDLEKPVLKARLSYDRHGRLKSVNDDSRKKHIYHPDGTIAEIRTGKNSIDRYNQRGDLISMEVRVNRRNAKGRVFDRFDVNLTARYEYDAHENWVRRTIFFKNEVQSVAVREIDYDEDR